MMGRTHALSGLVTGVAIGQFWWHLDPAHLAVGAAVTAGAAVLPDIDHPDASCADSFGFVTKGFAWLIGHVSGGHRHGTHSLVGVAAFTGAAWAAWHYLYTPAGKIGLGLLPEPLAFTTGTRPERWVVAPLMLAALVWLVAVVEKVVPAGRLPLH